MNNIPSIQGAGLFSKPKPKPAVLRPPHTGLFPNISSYSVAEVVDLVSDGPIYGLVNKSGQRDTIFKGIYFNNTPVEPYTKSDDEIILSPSGSSDNTWDDWFSDSQDFFNQFLSNGQTVRGYSYGGNAKNFFASLSQEGKDQGNIEDDKGRALLQFPFITQDHADLRVVKRSMPIKDDIGGTPFSVAKTGFYTTNLIDADFLINSSNNAELKTAIQESFYIQHGGNNFEIHYFNDEELPDIGISRSGTLLYDFEEDLNTLATETGTNLEKMRYCFIDKALKSLDKIKGRSFGQKRHLRNQNHKFGGFSAWNNSVEAVFPDDEIALVFKIGSSGSFVDLGRDDDLYNDVDNSSYVVAAAKTVGKLQDVTEEYLLDGSEAVKDFSFRIQSSMGLNQNNSVVLLIPELKRVDGTDYVSVRMTGNVFGVAVFFVKLRDSRRSARKFTDDIYRFSRAWHLKGLSNWDGSSQHNIQIVKSQLESARKFNFASVACEFKRGTELQTPLKQFAYSSVDYEYQAPLYGPFRTMVEDGSGVFRIKEDIKIWEDDGDPQWSVTGWEASDNAGALFKNSPATGNKVRRAESSEDVRNSESYSDWNDSREWNEESSPFTHVIENKETTHVGFSLLINELKDTLFQDIGVSNYKAGDPYPTVLHMHVEWGKVGPAGESISSSQRFKIVGLVQSPTLIDFGAVAKDSSDADNENFYLEMYSANGDPFIQKSADWDLNRDADWRGAPTTLFNPLELPTLNAAEKFRGEKRFIRIYKISAETNSVLLAKDVALMKITEIIKNQFRYPYSAIVGSKFDSRYFSSLPNRSFDCRLKLIKIPSNYEPLDDAGLDKRYLESSGDPKQQVYIGDWDGSFLLGWTDNPAWILYDLLTSERYGLGDYIDKRQINIWELYKIGRFCDAVDDLGYFVGVDDLNGGLEPRYSCNILFNENTKVFDAINVVANLFRGSVFFNNSEINFSDDRPKTPIAMFNNSNIQDGLFNYSSYRRDQQYNAVEIAFLDRFDDYNTKIEYIEDADDIRERGLSKTTINTIGVTSRAMARRIGKHIIHQSIKENQTVEFSAGLEALLCRPGDLITIDDEMKSRSRNFGRILNVGELAVTGDYQYGWLRLDESYSGALYNNYINVYAATGNYGYSDMLDLAKSNRIRLDSFSIGTTNEISGDYYFSGYSYGYDTPSYLQSEYFAVYTGALKKTCYFNTGSGAWLFEQSGDLYAKSAVNLYDISEIQDGIGSLFLPNGSNLTVSDFSFEGYTNGITDDEVSLSNMPQTARFYLSDKNNLNYGSEVLVEIPIAQTSLVNQYQAIELGSIYRFENTGVVSETYKVISIRENDASSYSIAASRYDTGKFEEIENLTRRAVKEETSFYGIASLEAEPYIQLETPNFITGTKSGGVIDVSWGAVSGAGGYFVTAYNKQNDILKRKSLSSATTGTTFTYNSDVTSKWIIKIHAVASDDGYFYDSEKSRLSL